ncbi:MAG: prepilin-type N-terminal cleavage/methylation domain-containing protein [Candidatus Nanopelagicales bacterium]
MFERIKAAREKEEGFTLIELLVVIIIIGILAAIAIPVFLNQRAKGWDSAVKADLRNAATAEETWLTDDGNYTENVADLELVGFKYSAGSNYAGGETAVMTIKADTNKEYCLQATSASDAVFVYKSPDGLGEVGEKLNGVEVTACA